MRIELIPEHCQLCGLSESLCPLGLLPLRHPFLIDLESHVERAPCNEHIGVSPHDIDEHGQREKMQRIEAATEIDVSNHPVDPCVCDTTKHGVEEHNNDHGPGRKPIALIPSIEVSQTHAQEEGNDDRTCVRLYVQNMSKDLGMIENIEGRMSRPEKELEQPKQPLSLFLTGDLIDLHKRHGSSDGANQISPIPEKNHMNLSNGTIGQ